MFFTGLATAVPTCRYLQKECWDVFAKSSLNQTLLPRSRAIVKRVLNGDNGIASRYLALDSLEEALNITPDSLHARFRKHAPLLASQAATKALVDAEIVPEQIDAILISTCTGYLCPGLSSYVSESLGLRADVLALDLVGQGCGAALPNLRTAEALLASHRCERVLSVCVEVCSAAIYFDNDPGVLVSACLFGDGAGAAVLSGKPNRKRRIEWKACASLLEPSLRDTLRFEQQNGMLRNILTPQVPGLAANHAESVLTKLLERVKVSRKHLNGWILHPGGRDVLISLRERLNLTNRDTRWSEVILREHGNLSSPSVFFVLQLALANSSPGGLWWMSSFGAGFSCHGALLEVE